MTNKNKITVAHILESYNTELIKVRTAGTFLRATCQKYGYKKEVQSLAIAETKLIARITHLREVRLAEVKNGSSGL